MTAALPPVAARRPKDVSVHGDPRIDDWFWLRDRDDPQVLDHLRAENEVLKNQIAAAEAERLHLHQTVTIARERLELLMDRLPEEA